MWGWKRMVGFIQEACSDPAATLCRNKFLVLWKLKVCAGSVPVVVREIRNVITTGSYSVAIAIVNRTSRRSERW